LEGIERDASGGSDEASTAVGERVGANMDRHIVALISAPPREASRMRSSLNNVAGAPVNP
jgi:hypothetical protein